MISAAMPETGLSDGAASSPPLIQSSVRIPALDGLRGAAILLVLLCHSLFELHVDSKFLSHALALGRLTWSGVDLFFVLSGFLIGGILLDAQGSPRYFSTFYARRAYRILPLYALVLAAFSLRFLTSHESAGPLGNFSSSSIPWASYATFSQNIWMALRGTFGVGTMAATWSLAVEEQFYLTIPLLIRKVDRSRLALVLGAIVVAAPLLRIAVLVVVKNGSLADYVLMPCRADSLSCGVLCALLVRTPGCWKFLLAHRPALSGAALVLFLGLIPLTLKGDKLSVVMVTAGYSWLALFYSACVLTALTGASAMFQRALRAPILTRMGMLAYCTYLLHLPLMEASRRLLGHLLPYSSTGTQFVGGVAGVLLSVAVAQLSWVFFEKPLIRRGHAHHY